MMPWRMAEFAAGDVQTLPPLSGNRPAHARHEAQKVAIVRFEVVRKGSRFSKNFEEKRS
jgi:hypothetical protein